MSHKKVDSVCFVLDASIARAAGPKDSKHPTGALCREFLEKIRGVCHRIAWNAAIKAEWDKHESKFATAWLVSMVRLRKVRHIPDEEVEHFREAIVAHSTDARVVEAMLKDAHLIEAALAADCRVASLDGTVRGHFSRLAVTCADLQNLLWIDPVTDAERCIEWVESGAPERPERFLRARNPS